MIKREAWYVRQCQDVMYRHLQQLCSLLSKWARADDDDDSFTPGQKDQGSGGAEVKSEWTADDKVSCSSNLWWSEQHSCTGETFAAHQLIKNFFGLWFHAGQVGQRGFLHLFFFSPERVAHAGQEIVRVVSKNQSYWMSLKIFKRCFGDVDHRPWEICPHLWGQMWCDFKSICLAAVCPA